MISLLLSRMVKYFHLMYFVEYVLLQTNFMTTNNTHVNTCPSTVRIKDSIACRHGLIITV